MSDHLPSPQRAGYAAHAFYRYQTPIGGDQCKKMTRWTPYVPNASAVERWPGHDARRSFLLDVAHPDSGSEGLLGDFVEVMFAK